MAQLQPSKAIASLAQLAAAGVRRPPQSRCTDHGKRSSRAGAAAGSYVAPAAVMERRSRPLVPFRRLADVARPAGGRGGAKIGRRHVKTLMRRDGDRRRSIAVFPHHEAGAGSRATNMRTFHICDDVGIGQQRLRTACQNKKTATNREKHYTLFLKVATSSVMSDLMNCNFHLWTLSQRMAEILVGLVHSSPVRWTWRVH